MSSEFWHSTRRRLGTGTNPLKKRILGFPRYRSTWEYRGAIFLLIVTRGAIHLERNLAPLSRDESVVDLATNSQTDLYQRSTGDRQTNGSCHFQARSFLLFAEP